MCQNDYGVISTFRARLALRPTAENKNGRRDPQNENWAPVSQSVRLDKHKTNSNHIGGHGVEKENYPDKKFITTPADAKAKLSGFASTLRLTQKGLLI